MPWTQTRSKPATAAAAKHAKEPRRFPAGPGTRLRRALRARLPVPEANACAERRPQDLNAQGYRVLSFSNRDVTTGIDVVLDTIHAALPPPTPTPNPSPQGGGGPEANA